jgi:hypothetical protein
MTSYPRFPNPPAVGHVTETQLPVSLPVGQLRTTAPLERPGPMGPAGVGQPSWDRPGPGIRYGAVRSATGHISRMASLYFQARVAGRAVAKGEHEYEEHEQPQHEPLSSRYPRSAGQHPAALPGDDDASRFRVPSNEEFEKQNAEAPPGARVPRTLRMAANLGERVEGWAARSGPSMVNTAQRTKVFGGKS